MEKKGVSLMVGYVLLIVFAIIMGAIVFSWLKTYVPQEGLDCPGGVIVFIKEAVFNNSNLTLNLVNTGRFDIAGYFIHASNISNQTFAPIDISPYLTGSQSKILGNSIVFVLGENNMAPGDEKTDVFTIPSSIGTIYSVTITPVRYQEEDKRQRFVSCGLAEETLPL